MLEETNIVSYQCFTEIADTKRLVFNGAHIPSTSMQMDVSEPFAFEGDVSLLFGGNAIRVADIINAVNGSIDAITIDRVHVTPDVVVAIINLGVRCKTAFRLELGYWPGSITSYQLSKETDPFMLYEQLLSAKRGSIS